MDTVLSLILGGGRGTRLFPLTQLRSKPAVPIAGKYRLIDIPISNCINSGCNRIYVLTQFLSVSLHRHIANTYKFDPFSRGFVEILAAQQTTEASDWYHGTADEKPQSPEQLKPVATPQDWIERRGVHAPGRPFLASMGIYLFKREALFHLLNAKPPATDFGKEIFPRSIQSHRVVVHLFDGYWED